jgi:hypothetical protein
MGCNVGGKEKSALEFAAALNARIVSELDEEFT